MTTDQKIQGIISKIKTILSHHLEFDGHKKLGAYKNYNVKVYKAKEETYFTIALNKSQTYLEISYHQSMDILSIETKNYSPEDFLINYQSMFIDDLYELLMDESFVNRILELKG